MRVTSFFLTLAGALLASQVHAAPTNLVTNGNFETTTGLGQIDSIVTVTGWTNVNPNNFNFILNTTADDAISGFGGGFTSVNSAGVGTNIFVWGPGNGASNGFTGSSNGGNFLGGDGGYATGAVTQTINGLTVGKEYILSFEWAAAQFTDQNGGFYAGWDVSFGGSTQSVTTGATLGTVAGQGFKPWENATMTFTASSTSQVLSFLATGPTGLPPFSLLDSVSLTEKTTVSTVPEPTSIAMMLAGGALLGGAARRRQRAAKQA
jgi:hypothetical protein